MSEELVPTTPEEFVAITTIIVIPDSGVVYRVRALGAVDTVAVLNIMPEEGLDDEDVLPFIKENIGVLADIASRHIDAPKIPVDRIPFGDVVTLIGAILDLTGISSGAEDDDEGFQKEPNG
jgi:hypothetical protein